VIGDAAHGMSPQLGQGTNLALLDARVLAHSLASHGTIEMAFAEYSRLRRKHLRFYQLASRWLTPVFQSDSRVMVGLRDWTFPALQTIPISYREALRMVTGVKTGVVFDWDVPLPR
jgi:2-polyprenyl-6-methoxyphenol hydroxylase-like FAD-dependent oxidoreductase